MQPVDPRTALTVPRRPVATPSQSVDPVMAGPPAWEPRPDPLLLRAVRKWWWALLGGVLAAAVATVYVAMQYGKPEYTYVGGMQYTRLGADYGGGVGSPNVATASQLLTAQIDFEALRDDVNDIGSLDEENLISALTAEVVKSSDIVEVTLTGEDSDRTRRLLDALMDQFAARFEKARIARLDADKAFAQSRLTSATKSLDSAKEELEKFQKEHDIGDDIRTDLAAAQEALREYEVSLAKLKVQTQALDSKIKSMQGARQGILDTAKSTHVELLREQLEQALAKYPEGSPKRVSLAALETKIAELAAAQELSLVEWKLKFVQLAASIRSHLRLASDASVDVLSTGVLDQAEKVLAERLAEEERLERERGPLDIETQQLGDPRKAASDRVDKLRNLKASFADKQQLAESAQLAFDAASRESDRISRLSNSNYQELTVFRPAELKSEGFGKWTKLLMAGVFAGVALVVCLPFFVYEHFAGREDPAFEAARRFGLPILARRPQSSWMTMRGGDGSREAEDEYLRMVALRIQQSVVRPGSVMLFSSLQLGDSPTPLVARLARCLAERDERVLVIETAQSAISDKALSGLMPKLPGEESQAGDGAEDVATRLRLPGLSDFLSFASMDLDDLIMPSTVAGIDCVLAGSLPCPREGMATPRMTELLDRCREKYTLLLVAGPSAAQATDLEMLAARADGILFTAGGHRAGGFQGDEAMRNLVELQAPIVGVIG